MHLYVAFVLLAHIYIFPIYFYTISVSGDYLSINNFCKNQMEALWWYIVHPLLS